MKKEKLSKRLLVFFLMLLLSVGLLTPRTVQASSYGLNKTSLSLYTGKSYQLKLSGTYGTQTWSSSNASVASVSPKGLVKARKAGKATITVRSGYYSRFTCSVTVKNPYLSDKKVTMVKGKTYTLKLNGTSIKSVKTSNSSIATIQKNGKITAKKNGTCKITITGANKKNYTCTVKVETPSLSRTGIKLQTGQTAVLKLNNNTQKVTWVSGSKSIAAVSSSGQISAVNQGVVKITAKVNTASYTCYVNCINQADTYTRAEWVYRLMKNRGISLTGNNSSANYYYADTKACPYGAYIEAAYTCGFLSDDTYTEDVPLFHPNDTATREFAAVTAVRVLGYQITDDMRLSCADSGSLNYPKEDYLAIENGLISLESGYFNPEQPITELAKQAMYTKINELDSSVTVTEPKDNVEYSTSSVTLDNSIAASYTLKQNEDGTYLVTMPESAQANSIYAGRNFILPENKKNPLPIALTAISVQRNPNGTVEITARQPQNIQQVLSSVEFAGHPTLISSKITSLVSGVTCTYQPKGSVKSASQDTRAYYMESPGDELTGLTVGGSTSLPGKLHFDFGKGIALTKKAKLKGSFDLEIPDITAKVDIDCGWSGVKINEAVVSISEKAKVTAKLEYTAAQSESAPGVSGSKELTRVPFQLGTSPLSLDLVISVFYDAKGSISIVYNVDATQGIQYQNGNFRNLCTFKNSLDLMNIEASAKTGAQVGLNITAFEIWDIIGVDGQIGPGVTASKKNHVTENLVCVDASLYMYGKVSLSQDTILGEFLKETYHYQLEKVVYNEHNSPLKAKIHFENNKKVPACTYGKGKITGYVYDGKTQAAISGARVCLIDGSATIKTIYTDSNGKYILENLSPKTYTLTVSATDYKTFDVKQKVEKNTSTYVESALMLLREETTPAMVKGDLIDGISGYRISGVTLKVRKGWNQTTGEVVKTLTADNSYNFWIEPGNYTLQASADGYVSETVNIAAVSDATITKDLTLVPKNASGGKLRIVLTWGYSPYDLDAHLFGPTVPGNGTFHTYYYSKNYYYGNSNIANLDLDDRYSYGPETTTVNKLNKSGTYRFYIHDYTNRAKSSSKALSQSNAKVTVYLNGKLKAVYHVPVNRGGTVWHVFDYNAKTQTLSAKNTMYYSSSPQTLQSAAGEQTDSSITAQLYQLSIVPEKESQENTEEAVEISNDTEEETSVELQIEEETEHLEETQNTDMN